MNWKPITNSFFTNISQSLAPHHIYSDTDLIGNIKTYIERNYQKNISVEFVASLFHMNRAYLSHIFKKKHGKSFGDHLNLVRLEHTKAAAPQTPFLCGAAALLWSLFCCHKHHPTISCAYGIRSTVCRPYSWYALI